jgi:hypothetical protein
MLSKQFVKSLGIGFSLFLLTALNFGQDGSDIRYVKTEQLANKDVGKWVHLDFGKNSFEIDGARERHGETIVVDVAGKKVVFLEHRFDDGLNNWFKQQYLESTDTFEGLKIRWVKSKLLSIDGNTIKVDAYFHYYTPTGNPYQDKAFTQEISFKKDLLSAVLIWVSNQ